MQTPRRSLKGAGLLRSFWRFPTLRPLAPGRIKDARRQDGRDQNNFLSAFRKKAFHKVGGKQDRGDKRQAK